MALSREVLDPAAVVTGHRGAAASRRHRWSWASSTPSNARSPNRTDRRPKTAPRRGRRREDVRAAAVVTEQRSVRAGSPSAAASLAAAVGRRGDGAVRGEHVADVDRPAVGRGEVRELGDRRQLQPVGEAFLPDVRVAANLAALDARADVRFGDRADLLALDDDVPAAIGSRCGGGPAAAASSCDSPPRTTMMWLHFLQRILKTLPRTLSSEIEYLVPQESQMIFINASIRRSRRDDGAIALPLAGTGQPIILRLAAACKRGGADSPGIPQLKRQ